MATTTTEAEGKPYRRAAAPGGGGAEDGSEDGGGEGALAVAAALTEERLAEEVLHFATNCPDCNAPAETNMKVTSELFGQSSLSSSVLWSV